MVSNSPILRFALEVLERGLADAVSERPRDGKMAVLALAQTIELVVKASLVEANIPIYTKDNKTIIIHDGLAQLAQHLGIDRLRMHARIQLLVDERNAIQHKYGSVDQVTLDYHLDTVFQFLRNVLATQFDLDLDAWLREESDPEVVKKLRFVLPAPVVSQETVAPVQAKELSATVEFISAFVAFETVVRTVLENGGLDASQMGSSLDLVMKALGNIEDPDTDLLKALPTVYKLRNSVIHGAHSPSEAEVGEALRIISQAADAMARVPHEVLKSALVANTLGRRGIRLPPPPLPDPCA